MKGHIRRRSANTWAIVLDVRDPQTGKRKRRWHSFAGTKREAQVECARLLTELKAGTAVEPSRMTVAAFLERWIEHMQGQVSPRSHERYAELCRKNLAPLLGGMVLTNLQPAHISAAYAKALASGHRQGRGGLSPRTVTHMHRILRQALQQAVRWQLLARNPAAAVRPPKVERQQMRVLDTDDTVELIETARGSTLFMPILLSVRCGLRRGEVAALRWRNVDLERGQISVVASAEQTDQGVREKEPKNGKGRTIVLSATEIEELRSHRVRQAQGLLALGVRLTDDHHVVAREDGQRLQPRSLTHAFVKFIRRHGLRQVRLHDLRHSHATHMLASGVHPKIAQERLGHSSVGITLDLYSHVLPGMQAEAVSRVDAVLRDALDRRSWKMKW
jgi:integrase